MYSTTMGGRKHQLTYRIKKTSSSCCFPGTVHVCRCSCGFCCYSAHKGIFPRGGKRQVVTIDKENSASLPKRKRASEKSLGILQLTNTSSFICFTLVKKIYTIIS